MKAGISEFLGFCKLPELKLNQDFICEKGCADIEPIFVEENNEVIFNGCSESGGIRSRKYSLVQVCNHCQSALAIYDFDTDDVTTDEYQLFTLAQERTETEK